jgi:hypothetical protein
MAATDVHAKMEELLEAVFSVRFVCRLYNEKQLRSRGSFVMAVRRIEGWREMVASLGISEVLVGE